MMSFAFNAVCRTVGAFFTFYFAVVVLRPSPAAAQAAFSPDAAARESVRNREAQRALRAQWEAVPGVHEATPLEDRTRLPVNEVPCFPIRTLALAGEGASEFQWALGAANPADDLVTGRCVGAEGIEAVVRRTQNAIVARGYVTTRVLVARQSLAGGTLTLTLVPGRVGDIRFEEGTSARAGAWNALPVRRGDVLNLRDLEQGLENFRQVPKVDVDIAIASPDGAHAAPGESDLVIRWRQGLPVRLNVGVNDAGSRYTGKYQGYVTFAHDNGFTLNDLFYVNLGHDLGGGERGDKGARSHTFHYSLPFGYWRLGATIGGYTYHQSVPMRYGPPIRYAGDSQNAELRLSRVLYRDAVRRLGVYVAGWTRASKNYFANRELLMQRRRMAGWEAGLVHREFIAGATVAMSLAYRRGTGAFGALPAPEAAFGGGTARPSIVLGDAQLHIPFAVGGARMRYLAAWRGQWNRTPLISQDRFSIGGRYTVRGFDGEQTLLGERGWFLRNDMGIQLGRTGQELYAGIDYGQVAGRSTRALPGTSIAGAVIGLRGAYRGFHWDVFTGRPLHQPPGFRAASTVAGFNVGWSS
ncbi:Hemolysin transporter protein ShlB [Pandoraea terrae]|uniref:Hemolysin transporter protein ShlB n=1 Tax=Pandoraea terrae TaxID=1537710 RepID=A0A5E4RB97_9BURK|nr:ShlB/FhaC/HecB family hemolysin secretion/activation protein [Pandoraea terrae]VVD60467.1 Hemolysin transporter protein ShlB [Pandoraea terrae]